MADPKIAAERLYFNEDKTKLVKEGDPEARFLAAAEGDEVPVIEKAAAKAEDKAVRRAGA